MDTLLNNDISLKQGGETQFGEYTSSVVGSQNGSGSNGKSQTTTKENVKNFYYNPSGGDILKATSDGPISLDNNSASNTDGFNTYFDTNVDILQASSAAGNEGAQFGEYKTTTKVNGVQSIYTPSIDAKPSDENTNTTQLLGQTVANTTTNFNLEGFDFGSTNDAY